jgi:glucokinase
MWQADGVLLGVDVGGTKVAAARVEGRRAHDRVEHPTDLDSGAELLDGIEAAVAEVVKRAGPPAAVGIGIPSQIEFATGRVLSSVNVPLEGVSLRDELAPRLGVPVFVDNDANVAALAESVAAEGERATDIVMLTLGTGVGGGVVIGGEVFRGATGLGAELGHLVIDHEGPECPGNCPSRGCIEALCSGTALARDATAFGRDHPDSALGRVVAERGRATGRDAVRAARDGDADALALLDRLGTLLGVGIAGVANAFQPHQVVIGGGLSQAADLFLDAARREAHARALPVISERVSISSARTGPDAGVIGAGLLAAQEIARAEGRATREALEST